MAVIVVASFIFIVPRLRPTSSVTPGATCNLSQTTSAIPPNSSVVALSFVSPQDGWGVGFTGTTPGTTGLHSLIVHLPDCRWQSVGPSLLGVTLVSIGMVTSDEGRAISVTMPSTTSKLVLLHDNGGTWQSMALPVIDAPHLSGSPILRMVSANDGWMSGIRQGGANVLLHQHGQLLTEESHLGGVHKLFMLSPTEGWAFVIDQTSQGSLWHYHSSCVRPHLIAS